MNNRFIMLFLISYFIILFFLSAGCERANQAVFEADIEDRNPWTHLNFQK